MNLIQSIFEALESLSANKLRSALTILGIAFDRQIATFKIIGRFLKPINPREKFN